MQQKTTIFFAAAGVKLLSAAIREIYPGEGAQPLRRRQSREPGEAVRAAAGGNIRWQPAGGDLTPPRGSCPEIDKAVPEE